jgi:DNA-binding response OmpR family regulator
MKSPQRILIAHADIGVRRLLAMLLVEAGLDVLAVEPGLKMISAAQGESFDLAVVGCKTSSEESFALAGKLRADCPRLLIVMLIEELELSLVVKGIRQGLTDVLPLTGDHRVVVQRVLALLNGDVPAGEASLNVAEIEAMVSQLEPTLNAVSADRDRGELCARLKRAVQELQCERERVATAQTAIDERARLLADERAELIGERAYVEKMADQVERDQRQLAEAQEGWEAAREDLQTREISLRAYEERLRRLQAETAGAVLTAPPYAMVEAAKSDAQLAHGWTALEKAQAALDSERALFRDQRMLIAELDNQIRHRETRLREIEQSIVDRDRVRRGLPPPPPELFAKSAVSDSPLTPPKKRGMRTLFLGKRADRLVAG